MSLDMLSTDLMSPLGVTAVAAGGGVGAVCRFGLDTAVQRWRAGGERREGPFGILLVNLLACLGIGLAGVDQFGIDQVGDGRAGAPGLLGLALASGLLGGFSTFSTVAVDTARLIRAKRWGWTVLNSAGMLALGSAACLATWALGRWILG